MQYDKPPMRHYLGARDFGTASDILCYFKGPLGKGGRLYDVGICNILEAFIATTLHPGMSVGTVADDDAYMDTLRFTSAAIAGGCYSLRSLKRTYDSDWGTYMILDRLPADTVIMVTLVAGTGGSDTGQATPFVDVIWDD